MTNSTLPFFSVIVATHKRPYLLERCINSILNQTYENNNFIIVSDAEDISTYSIITPRLRSKDFFIQRSGIQGPSESRNLALQLASGTHIVFLDDDDAFHPDYFKNIVNSNILNNKEAIIYTNIEIIDNSQNSKPIPIDLSIKNKEDLWVKNFIPNNCVFYPYKIAKNILFDSSIAYEDWDYLLSAVSIAEILYLPIYGAIVYKNSEPNEIPRGEKNNQYLLDCYIKIYTKHNHINAENYQKRIELFNSMSLNLELLLNNNKGIS